MKKIPKRRKIAKTMPPLHHSGENDFTLEKSEVISWLISQPDILNYIFDVVCRHGYSESLIIFNPSTKTWQGVDYGQN